MLVPCNILKIELASTFTAVHIGNQENSFVIFLESSSGKLLQMLVSQADYERPVCFNLVQSLITATDLKPLKVFIENEEEGVYFCKIFIEKPDSEIKEIYEIEARPSEALALSLAYKIPIFTYSNLIEKVSLINDPK
jgi:hypothetical protein